MEPYEPEINEPEEDILSLSNDGSHENEHEKHILNSLLGDADSENDYEYDDEHHADAYQRLS